MCVTSEKVIKMLKKTASCGPFRWLKIKQSLCVLVAALCASPALAQNVSADSVTDNGTPARWGSSSCQATLPELSDGSNANPGICFLGPVDPTYTIDFAFSPANAEFLTGIQIWANEGRNMRDNELLHSHRFSNCVIAYEI